MSTYEHIVAIQEAQRIATEARLASDPLYQEREAAADLEAIETPDCWFARNLLFLTVENEMPSIMQTVRVLHAERAHEALYDDPRRVHRARVQAEGRIGAGKLRRLLIESWAIPILDWLTARLPERPTQ